ncbi:putative 2-C-methyl-D-erythritol 4-phosphate cytidylyltransferase [Roseibium sp. TrichSKD4]|uniref:hypothetical protein n=1 Tax=Roseibium sp. TrichSKD4 TaxID=744980 RepID=UPI0001E56D52|nr:hypothetical protein [Roseibium sp. TrichSKD4]EFO33280.1 putative 2-C-methyl-D-erythritol 4-phosphate cytidylyltransferase [Roseibium sp. TrichSKD4]
MAAAAGFEPATWRLTVDVVLQASALAVCFFFKFGALGGSPEQVVSVGGKGVMKHQNLRLSSLDDTAISRRRGSTHAFQVPAM